MAQLTGSDGSTLRVAHNATDDRPDVTRQGIPRRWDEEIDVYKTLGDTPVISQSWGGHSLNLQAGGETFASSFTANR